MARFRLVSFDVWNTLLNLEAMVGFIVEGLVEATGRPLGAVRAAFSEARRRAKELRARAAVEDPLAESQAILAAELRTTVDRVRRGVAAGVMRALEHVEELVYPDARRGLEDASRLAERVAVLGNVLFWPGSYTRLLLEKAKLAHFIDLQVYADEVGYYKPDRRIFHLLCREAGVEPWEAVHVGDEVSEDAGGALAAGMWAVMVRRGYSGRLVVPEARLAVIGSLSVLGEVLGELGGSTSS
jgi:putative hydrolase of the HAD superfamily